MRKIRREVSPNTKYTQDNWYLHSIKTELFFSGSVLQYLMAPLSIFASYLVVCLLSNASREGFFFFFFFSCWKACSSNDHIFQERPLYWFYLTTCLDEINSNRRCIIFSLVYLYKSYCINFALYSIPTRVSIESKGTTIRPTISKDEYIYIYPSFHSPILRKWNIVKASSDPLGAVASTYYLSQTTTIPLCKVQSIMHVAHLACIYIYIYIYTTVHSIAILWQKLRI